MFESLSDSAPQSLQHSKNWGPVASLARDAYSLALRYLQRSRSRLAPRWVQRAKPEQLLFSAHLPRDLVLPEPRLRPPTPTTAALQRAVQKRWELGPPPPSRNASGKRAGITELIVRVSPSALPMELQFPAGWA